MGIYKNIAGFIIGVILLSGCAINTEFYNKDDKLIGRVKQDQPGAASCEGAEGLKMAVDTRKPTAWERFITPMVQGASGAAKASISAD